MHKPTILFIVEGVGKDCRFINEMANSFFTGRYEIEYVILPAFGNIYMIYNKLVHDDFETDVVEVLKETLNKAIDELAERGRTRTDKSIENTIKRTQTILSEKKRQDIDQVYLFFDYDVHQNNIGQQSGYTPEVIEKMLDVFDNETENGKLYISYPMVEALYDYKRYSCEASSKCFVDGDMGDDYKSFSSKDNQNAYHKMTKENWQNAINNYYLRIKCLFELNNLDFDEYKETITPVRIYDRESKLLMSKNLIFVLSAFPEFLLDYFKKNFWNNNVKRKKIKFNSCPEKANSQ